MKISFEVPLWDLKPKFWNFKKCSSKFWSTPMGFETTTFFVFCKKNYVCFEVPLWDLKRNSKRTCWISWRFWSTPMGFETWQYLFCHILFSSVLKYPYGIWNTSRFTRFIGSAQVLKYPYGIWNHCSRFACCLLGRVLKYPYGIWNTISLPTNGIFSLFWSTPMGFETLTTCKILYCIFSFEVPLWDLKLCFKSLWR